MSVGPMDKCEAEIDGAWRVVGIGDAIKLPKTIRLRCWACHGRAVANPQAKGLAVPHFSHYDAFDGCKKVPTKAQPLHPKAIS